MLEQLFDLKSIKGNWINITLLGIVYTFIGTYSALLLFPNYVSIMSLSFTALLLIPSVGYLLQKEDNIIRKDSHLSFISIFRQHKDIVRLYILLFFGVFLAFLLIGFFGSNEYVSQYFSAQMKVAGISGQAVGTGADFFSIIANNLLVFAICFVLSLAYGAGSIIFIVWNASVWGIVFGYFLRQSAAEAGNIFLYLGKIFLPFLPHMLTEAASYIIAAMMGGVIAKAVIRETHFSKNFYHVLKEGIVFASFGFLLVVFAAVLEVFVFPLFL
jgi:uncharacterized membrane protein SpoIIM required for sporulation